MTVTLDDDLHVHSTWSDDAHSTLAENLAAAAERGLHRVRLTEHVRRSSTWLPRFAAAVAAEARRFAENVAPVVREARAWCARSLRSVAAALNAVCVSRSPRVSRWA